MRKTRYGVGSVRQPLRMLAQGFYGPVPYVEVWTSSLFAAWYHEQRIGWREYWKWLKGEPHGLVFTMMEVTDEPEE